MICAPVPDRALDVFLRLELIVESTARQLGCFVVRREADCDQLARAQFTNPSTQIARQDALESCPFLEANDPVLCFDRHESKVEHSEKERERHYDSPTGHETRVAHELNSCHDDVDEEHRHREEMIDRYVPPVICVGLRRLRHRCSLLYCLVDRNEHSGRRGMRESETLFLTRSLRRAAGYAVCGSASRA